MSSLPFAALESSGGFRADPRFQHGSLPNPPAPSAGDPLATAWEEGFAAGAATVREEAEAVRQADLALLARLDLSFAQLDAERTEQLRLKLYATVEALCEAAIAPLMLDREALAARVARAAAMLARADDDKVLRLHPDDLSLLEGRLPDGLATQPDPSLERGALRIETQGGGVEDGPSHWRRAIAEAIEQC